MQHTALGAPITPLAGAVSGIEEGVGLAKDINSLQASNRQNAIDQIAYNQKMEDEARGNQVAPIDSIYERLNIAGKPTVQKYMDQIIEPFRTGEHKNLLKRKDMDAIVSIAAQPAWLERIAEAHVTDSETALNTAEMNFQQLRQSGKAKPEDLQQAQAAINKAKLNRDDMYQRQEKVMGGLKNMMAGWPLDVQDKIRTGAWTVDRGAAEVQQRAIELKQKDSADIQMYEMMKKDPEGAMRYLKTRYPHEDPNKWQQQFDLREELKTKRIELKDLEKELMEHEATAIPPPKDYRDASKEYKSYRVKTRSLQSQIQSAKDEINGLTGKVESPRSVDVSTPNNATPARTPQYSKGDVIILPNGDRLQFNGEDVKDQRSWKKL